MKITPKRVIAFIICSVLHFFLLWHYLLQSGEKAGNTYKNRHFQHGKRTSKPYGLNKQVSTETSKHVTKGNCMGLEFPVRLVQNDTWSAISDRERVCVFCIQVGRQYNSGWCKLDINKIVLSVLACVTP